MLAAALVVLAGCASHAPRPTAAQQPWSERRAQLQGLSDFELKGRVAVATGSEGFNGHLTWQQQDARSIVVIDGPLGVGGVRIMADGAALSVTNSKGAVLDSDAARAELLARLGFEPPLASLRYWVLGVPDPAQPATETVDADQRLVSLAQGGWEIQYTDYMSAGGRWLPRRVSLHRNDVRARLFVDDWHV